MATPGQPNRAEPSIPPSDGSCRVTQLPPEIALHVVKNITSKTDLLNILVTCKYLRDPAETMLWSVCNTRGYEKLLSLPPIEQKYHSTKVHMLLLDFEDNSLQPGDLELQLPCLRDLSIVHWSHNTVNLQVKVSKLITPKLIYLRIANGSTDNFLLALRQAKDLEVLSLGLPVRINGVDPSQLLSLVRTMRRLTTLDAGALACSELLIEATGRNFVALHLQRVTIGFSQVSKALQIPQPFSCLRSFTARMQASAAVLLLGNLPHLEKLSLHITTALSPGETHTSAVIAVIKAVGAKTELSHMWLSFSSVPITIDIKHFAPLKDLINLNFFGLAHQFALQFRVTDDQQPFSSLCPLRVLFLDFLTITLAGHFDRIAKNHRDLQELVYKRHFLFRQMSSQFPSLLRMDVGSTDIALTESNWPTAMATLARRLIGIAPRLKRFRTGHNGTIDIEIHFEHSPNWITCTGRNEWNDAVLFVI